MNTKTLQRLTGLFLGLAALNTSYAADKEDQFDIAFTEGSVHIYCFQPEDADDEVFTDAFPKLITNLQENANEGLVLRAHYLEEIKNGIFIVVGGETREDAVANGAQLLAEQKAILDEALEASGSQTTVDLSAETCRVIEVGPVAILPNK